MLPRGVAVEPAWMREDFVPGLTEIEAPITAELRVEHLALLARVDETQRAMAEVRDREAPADRDQAVTWMFSGGMAANAAFRAAREEADAAIVAVCDWVSALAGSPDRLEVELANLSGLVAANDEARRPGVRRLQAFVEQVGARDTRRAVERVHRANGGLRAAGAGVAW